MTAELVEHDRVINECTSKSHCLLPLS